MAGAVIGCAQGDRQFESLGVQGVCQAADEAGEPVALGRVYPLVIQINAVEAVGNGRVHQHVDLVALRGRIVQKGQQGSGIHHFAAVGNVQIFFIFPGGGGRHFALQVAIAHQLQCAQAQDAQLGQ